MHIDDSLCICYFLKKHMVFFERVFPHARKVIFGLEAVWVANVPYSWKLSGAARREEGVSHKSTKPDEALVYIEDGLTGSITNPGTGSSLTIDAEPEGMYIKQIVAGKSISQAYRANKMASRRLDGVNLFIEHESEE